MIKIEDSESVLVPKSKLIEWRESMASHGVHGRRIEIQKYIDEAIKNEVEQSDE